jgi:hypothetical protein
MSFEFLNDDEKMELAQFMKRVCFDTALEYSEGKDEEQKQNAYFLCSVFNKVREELAKEGYAPR